MKLQKKYFLTFFALFLVLSIGLSLTSYFISRSILITKYQELSTENLSYLADITDKEMNQLISLFEFIGGYEAMNQRITTEYSKDDAYQKMKDDTELTDLFFSLNADDLFSAVELIYVIGNNGEEYWYGVGSDYLRGDDARAVLEQSTYHMGILNYEGIGKTFNSLHLERNVLRFTRQLVELSGEPYGRIYFELDAKYLETIYHSDRLLSETSIELVDGDGYGLYLQDEEYIGQYVGANSSEGIVTEDAISLYGWKIRSVTPKSYVTLDSSNVFTMTMAMATISIFIAMIAISYITKRFVKPIKDLTMAVGDVIEGDYSVTVDHVSEDEIGILGDRFNLMTVKIKENISSELAYVKAINDAEYQALQAQINPHFMYNSLNTLKWIASLQGADNIIEIVDALWLLLKKTSSLSGQIITLENELEVVSAFVVVQQARYNGKFDIVYNIDPAHMAYELPKYILQPFVENAIFHGIEPKEGQGRITITTTKEDGILVVEISDDGVGVSEDQIKAILRHREVGSREALHNLGLNNIGVMNVDERLKLLYGDEYGIEIFSSIGLGTSIKIKIPIDEKDKEA